MHLHLCISFARIKRTILHTKAAPKRSDFSVPLLMQKIECLRLEEENDGLNNREYPQEYLVISKEIWKIYGLRVCISHFDQKVSLLRYSKMSMAFVNDVQKWIKLRKLCHLRVDADLRIEHLHGTLGKTAMHCIESLFVSFEAILKTSYGFLNNISHKHRNRSFWRISFSICIHVLVVMLLLL